MPDSFFVNLPSVISTAVSLSLPSAARYLPVVLFCTVNFSAPLSSASVTFSASTVFVIFRSPFCLVYSSFSSMTDSLPSSTFFVPSVLEVDFRV